MMNCEKIYISGRYRNTVTSLSRIIMWHLKQSKHNFRILLDNPNQSASCKLIMFKELNKGLHEINLSNAGFYFLEIKNQNYFPILIKN